MPELQQALRDHYWSVVRRKGPSYFAVKWGVRPSDDEHALDTTIAGIDGYKEAENPTFTRIERRLHTLWNAHLAARPAEQARWRSRGGPLRLIDIGGGCGAEACRLVRSFQGGPLLAVAADCSAAAHRLAVRRSVKEGLAGAVFPIHLHLLRDTPEGDARMTGLDAVQRVLGEQVGAIGPTFTQGFDVILMHHFVHQLDPRDDPHLLRTIDGLLDPEGFRVVIVADMHVDHPMRSRNPRMRVQSNPEIFDFRGFRPVRFFDMGSMSALFDHKLAKLPYAAMEGPEFERSPELEKTSRFGSRYGAVSAIYMGRLEHP